MKSRAYMAIFQQVFQQNDVITALPFSKPFKRVIDKKFGDVVYKWLIITSILKKSVFLVTVL